MDTTRDVTYRDFLLNDASIRDAIDADTGIGKGITGCVIDSWEDTDADVSQFLEKRSLQDGMDAGDVFLGARRIRLAGTLYGKTRALLYDQYMELRRVLSPVLSQREEPEDKGYRALTFAIPTNRIEDYPDLAIDLKYLALPRAKQLVWQRDQQGGEDGDALAIPWQATFLCKDPTLYGDPRIEIALADTTVVTGATAGTNDTVAKTAHGLVAGDQIYFTVLTGGTGLSLNQRYYVIASGLTSGVFKVSLSSGGSAVDITVAYTTVNYAKVRTDSGTLTNRGTYIAPVNLIIEVTKLAGTIVVTIDGTIFTLTIPASTGNRVLRYDGKEKTVHLEEDEQNDLRMDLISFEADETHPLIPEGDSPYSLVYTGLVLDASAGTGVLWYDEAYA